MPGFPDEIGSTFMGGIVVDVFEHFALLRFRSGGSVYNGNGLCEIWFSSFDKAREFFEMMKKGDAEIS